MHLFGTVFTPLLGARLLGLANRILVARQRRQQCQQGTSRPGRQRRREIRPKTVRRTRSRWRRCCRPSHRPRHHPRPPRRRRRRRRRGQWLAPAVAGHGPQTSFGTLGSSPGGGARLPAETCGGWGGACWMASDARGATPPSCWAVSRAACSCSKSSRMRWVTSVASFSCPRRIRSWSSNRFMRSRCATS